MLLTGFSTLVWLLYLIMLVLAVVALFLAATAREDAYRAADKQKKSFWLIILGITVAVNLFVPMLFLQLAGAVASIVFMVDVRPALKAVSGGGGGGAVVPAATVRTGPTTAVAERSRVTPMRGGGAEGTRSGPDHHCGSGRCSGRGRAAGPRRRR